MYNFNFYSDEANELLTYQEAPQGKNITSPYKVSDNLLRFGFGSKWLRNGQSGWYAINDQEIFSLVVGNTGGLNVISSPPGKISGFMCHAYLFRNPNNGKLAYACFFTVNTTHEDAYDEMFFFTRVSYNRDVGKDGQTVNWIVQHQIASIHFKVMAPSGYDYLPTTPLFWFGPQGVVLTYTSDGTISSERTTSVTATEFTVPDTIWVVDKRTQLTNDEILLRTEKVLEEVEGIVGNLSNKFVSI
jgi:hypothetical protein